MPTRAAHPDLVPPDAPPGPVASPPPERGPEPGVPETIRRLRGCGADGAERAVRVAWGGTTPVLAAPRGAAGAFRRAVAAVDFSPAGVRAAEVAWRLLVPGGTLSLVHVRQRLVLGGPAAEAWETLCSGQVAELLRRLVALLRGGGAARRDVTIGVVTLVGDPADEVAAYAGSVGADLVACGTRGNRYVERRHPGTVSARLARRVCETLPDCSLLVCPEALPAASGPGTPPPTRPAPPWTSDVLDPATWRPALAGFARRNAGRRAGVEVDEPGVGALSVARGLVLAGASYDPRTGRAELSLAGPIDPASCLTRSMPGVRSVAVLADRGGREIALRVEHGGGQTILTFLPDGAP